MNTPLSFLIIEDDKYTRFSLRETLKEYGAIEEASSFTEAKEKLSSYSYDVVITDIDLEGNSALDLFPLIKSSKSHCIVVSSQESDDVIEKAYSEGAKHFLSKFKVRTELEIYIKKFLQFRSNYIQEIIQQNFITHNEELQSNLARLCEVNWKNRSLFISGATGTGKSLLGKVLHEVTHKEKNFVHLNCSEISENLLESELFGHEKGAFTGADSKKIGKLKEADGGTLFLDEIATMSLSMQQKLLKAIDEKTFYPVGATKPETSNYTLITATCEDIGELIREKKFREDFFYRISGFKFHLKSLKERPNDIRFIARHYQNLSPRRFVIKEEALQFLETYHWPGNIRELRLLIERLSQMSTGIIELKDIQTLLSSSDSESRIPIPNEEIKKNGLKSYISQIEKMAVREAMKRNEGKITSCIKELKISASAFYRILNEI